MTTNREIVDLDRMVSGYLDCQLWAGVDMSREDTNLDENYDRSSISAGYVDRVRTEISAVVSAHPKAVLMYLTAQGDDDGNGQFGHDLYLTRDHHGVGFWDRGLGELGDYLTSVAHALGESDQLFDNGYGMLIA